MRVEVNSKFVKAEDSFAEGRIMVTPPIDADYWLFRVSLTDKQAVVAFPKFGLIGIGFQHEEDWNTNLPSDCEAEEIAKHIWHNRGDETISHEALVEAIELLRGAAAYYQSKRKDS